VLAASLAIMVERLKRFLKPKSLTPPVPLNQ